MNLDDIASDRPEWHKDALCRHYPTKIFFGNDEHHRATYNQAKTICAQCTVKPECLEYALANNERFGCWGGTSPRERTRLRSDRGAA